MKEVTEGYYWIRQELPVTDGAGLLREEWGPPMLARRVGLDWYPLVEGGAVADQFSVEVLSERLDPPAFEESESRRQDDLDELERLSREVNRLRMEVASAQAPLAALKSELALYFNQAACPGQPEPLHVLHRMQVHFAQWAPARKDGE